ncbi:MAG: magnesium transporter [Alphaproteobacteria bacterium]
MEKNLSLPEDEEFDEENGLSSEAFKSLLHQLYEGDVNGLQEEISFMHEALVAEFLEKISTEDRKDLLPLISKSLEPEVFAWLAPEVRQQILDVLEPKDIGRIVALLDSDDALDLISYLDEDLQRQVLSEVSAHTRAMVEQGLSFPEASAGRLMQREVVSIPRFWTVGKTLDYLKATADTPDGFYDVFVVDALHRLVGRLPLSRLIKNSRSVKLESLADEDVHAIDVNLDQEEVAMRFRRFGLVCAPVVDEQGVLLGVITVDDIVHVIDEEAGEDILKLGGVVDTDIHSSILTTSRLRFSWLFINLLTALLASWVISFFEETLTKAVVLAVLMPIVASMGGNAGTQTVTVVVRALATRDITDANALRVLYKELAVGVANGLLFAVLMALCVWAWYGQWRIGLVMGMAMMVNLLAASLAGTLIPLALDKLRFDPAISSTVFLTTVTDIIGFFAFLGFASLMLSWL